MPGDTVLDDLISADRCDGSGEKPLTVYVGRVGVCGICHQTEPILKGGRLVEHQHWVWKPMACRCARDGGTWCYARSRARLKVQGRDVTELKERRTRTGKLLPRHITDPAVLDRIARLMWVAQQRST